MPLKVLITRLLLITACLSICIDALIIQASGGVVDSSENLSISEQTESSPPTPTPTATASPFATLRFASSVYQVNEGNTAPIGVYGFVHPSFGSETANVRLSDGTAVGGTACTEGVDYIRVDQTLLFTFGGSGYQEALVVTCPDTIPEPDETVVLRLSCGSAFCTVLPPGEATLTISGNSPSPTPSPTCAPGAAGLLDPSFDTDGKVTTSIGDAYSVAIQPDGRIVAAGYGGNGSNFDFALVRYNTNGTLDTSFDTDGKVTTAIGSFNDFGFSVAIQPDSRIVAAGSSLSSTSNYDFALVRYNTDGTLDTSFDTDGKVTTDIAISDDGASSVAIQPDGRIVAAGYIDYFGSSNVDFALVRYNPDGTLDTSFDSDGRVITDIGSTTRDIAQSVAIQPDGRIVAAGYSGGFGFALVRYFGGCPVPTRRVFDYDADGRTDFSVFRPLERNWYLQKSTEGFLGYQFGISTDRIVPADYDGDARTDIAVYRKDDGTWYIANSSDGTFSAFVFGLSADLPVPGDFDGDGEADVAVFRPLDGTWYWRNSSNGQFGGFQWGHAGDRPMMGDFDADGRTDFAVFRPSNGYWYIYQSSNGAVRTDAFGLDGDIPLNGDFNGDGRSDLAVFRPSDRTWYVARPTGVPGQNFDATRFGVATDLPVPGDYDGDGRTDISVFRPSDGHWYRQNSSNGSFNAYQFGVNGDRPTPTAFH